MNTKKSKLKPKCKRHYFSPHTGKSMLLGFEVVLGLMFFTSCVSTHKDPLSTSIDANELSGHVHFLAQPALKGRKPFSSGSRTARKFISRQFKAYGLVPWGQAESYTQSLVIGTNVIGVLPGSDPNLKDEFIIVCAHYDHLGKTGDGMCLGACDNASGVAALLEIAETLSLSEIRPKRSICFAAFDCEEIGLLGSFSFSSRSDFDESKIAGIVNIDLLGRYGYEVLEEHVFVSGIEGHAPLREKLKQADSDIHLLPVSQDIVGIRGDHFPFELLECPVLFFSCGLFKDYHKSTDTADKLNYHKMSGSAGVILHTIDVMANQPERFVRKISPEGQREVLTSLQTCLNHIIAGYTKLGWTQTEVDSMEVLLNKLKEFQQESQIDAQSRRMLLLSQYEHLRPLILWPTFPILPEDSNDPNTTQTNWLTRSFLQNPVSREYVLGVLAPDFYPEIIGIGRAFIGHLEKHRSRLLSGIPEFSHKEYVFPDNYISLTNIDKDTYCLVYVIATLNLKINPPGLLKLFINDDSMVRHSFNLNSFVFKGTKGELIDNCLLRWKSRELIKQKYPTLEEGVEDGHRQKVLSRIAETTSPETHQQWLEYRLTQTGWETEEQWLLHNIKSTNPDVAKPAIGLIYRLLPGRAEQILIDLITNESLHTDIRESAIRTLNNVGSPTLLFLVNLLDDETDCSSTKTEVCTENLLGKIVEFNRLNFLSLVNDTRRTMQIPKEGTYYSSYRKVTLTFDSKGKPIVKETEGPPEVGNVVPPFFQPGTLGDCAWLRLARLTKQNFEKNKEKWINWIQAHEGQKFPDPEKQTPPKIIKIGF